MQFRDAILIAAVIEEPGRPHVVEIFDVGVGRVAIIDGHPDGTGAHETQHAEEDAGVVDRVDCDGLFAAETADPHGAGDALAGGEDFGVGVTFVAVDDGHAVGGGFGLLVEIIYGSHGLGIW